jgi:hypothetical protein
MNSTIQMSATVTVANILVEALTELTPKKVFSNMSLINKGITCLAALNVVMVLVGPVMTPKAPVINQIYFTAYDTMFPDKSKMGLVEENCKSKFTDAKYEHQDGIVLCYR